MKITLTTLPEDITPEQAERMHGYAEGFAKSVRQVQDSIESSSDKQWGWCTVKVSVEVKDAFHGIWRTGDAYLGVCSYKSASDFIANSGYFQDLVSEALSNAQPVKLRQRGVMAAAEASAATTSNEADSKAEFDDSFSIIQDCLDKTRAGDYVTLKNLAEVQRQCESNAPNSIKHGELYRVTSFFIDPVTGKRLVQLWATVGFSRKTSKRVIISLPSTWFRPATPEELAMVDS